MSGRREETVKRRQPHAAEAERILTPEARRFLHQELAAAGLPVPAPMVASLVSSYRRGTLVTADRRTRVTCDTALVWSTATHHRRAGRDLILLEVKSSTERNPITEAVSASGRPR